MLFYVLFEGTLLHFHRFEDEVFYVLEGKIQFYIHNRTVTMSEGSCVFAPRHVAHAWRNPNGTNSQLARVQFFFFPGGIEGYFQQASRAAYQIPPNNELINKIAKEWGVENIGEADWDDEN
jgi:glyoxylate utilization-related uncharacterized protein